MKESTVKGILLILIGLAGVFFGISKMDTLNKYDEVTAEISEVRGISADSNTVYVDYVYNGESFKHKFLPSFSSSSFEEGNTVTILVNPDDPSEIISKKESGVGIGGFIFGLALVLCGAAEILGISKIKFGR